MDAPLSTAWHYYCDGCGLPARLTREGRWHCQNCGHPLWLTLPAGRGPELLGGSVVPDREEAPLAAACATHPEWRAAGTCERCGDFRCNPCTRVLQGRFYCAACFEQLTRRPAWKSLTSRFPRLFLMVMVALAVAVVQVILMALGQR